MKLNIDAHKFYLFLINLRIELIIIKENCEIENIDSNYQDFFLSSDLVIFPSFDIQLCQKLPLHQQVCACF